MECIVIFVTCKDEIEAQKISSKLLEEHLVACVNIVKHVKSLFHWEGNIEQADEVLLSIKTRRDLFDAVKHEVKELHSYDVPEVIAIPIVEGDEDYLNWIKKETHIEKN